MELIIEIPYAGLGDHLFHSHLPRIAKQFGNYEKVYVSSLSESWNVDCMRIVWEMNPYVDGFVDKRGISSDLKSIAEKIEEKVRRDETDFPNLLDEIMYVYGLDDGKLMHEPELYYLPKYRPEFHKIIFDPNFISYTGELTESDVSAYFRRKAVKFDSFMKIRSVKALHKENPKNNYISTSNLEEFCDLLFSCKEIHCFTTGTATLAPALGKKAHVYFGKGHAIAMRHSKLNEYIFIDKCFKNKVLIKIKSILKRILFR